MRPADLIKPELNKLRSEIGNLAKSEEDVLTYAMFPDIGRKFLEEREAGTLKPEELLPIPTGRASPPLARKAPRPSSSSTCTARPTASTSPGSA